jgi:hypothetical protein
LFGYFFGGIGFGGIDSFDGGSGRKFVLSGVEGLLGIGFGWELGFHETVLRGLGVSGGGGFV